MEWNCAIENGMETVITNNDPDLLIKETRTTHLVFQWWHFCAKLSCWHILGTAGTACSYSYMAVATINFMH